MYKLQPCCSLYEFKGTVRRKLMWDKSGINR
jgi:hypothetical protein